MSIVPLLELHRSAGARLTADDSSAQLLTYGDVPAEYSAGRKSALLLDESDAEAVLVDGSDAESFLHRLLANRVKGLESGQGNANLLLSAKGKILHAIELQRTNTGFRLGAKPGDAAGLLAALDMYLFSEDLTLTDASADSAPLRLLGPAAAQLIEQVLGQAPPSGDRRHLELTHQGRTLRLAQSPLGELPGWTLDAGPAGAPELWQALTTAGAQPGGLVAFDSLRVEACVAAWAVDVDDNVYPQEARWEQAFSLDKGCYIGQEVVAKIDTYGGLNKRLMGLSVEGDDAVPPGTRLYREDAGEWRDLGVVTSWAYSFALDGGMALAYIKRKHQEPGTVFRLGDGPLTATLVETPLA
ncbi:MAG: folate-binding protein YgfZ [Planctomycetota bacterium]